MQLQMRSLNCSTQIIKFLVFDIQIICFIVLTLIIDCNFQKAKMDKTRKNTNSSSSKLLKKKSVPLFNKLLTKSHKYILSKSRNTLEQTRDTFTVNKTAPNKNLKEGLTNYSSSTQFTQPQPHFINTKVLENRMNTEYQNRFSNPGKSPSQKQKSFLKKPKLEGEAKVKSRLSLNDKKGRDLCNNSFHKQKQIERSTNAMCSIQQLAKHRQNIQKEIKKSCKKGKIEKKDLLKITNQYQKLLDRFVFTEIPLNQTVENYKAKNEVNVNLSCLDESSASLQIENQPVTVPVHNKKVKLLQLNNLKKLGIQDYNDQFMSHYEELSQSWKRDIDIQKRF